MQRLFERLSEVYYDGTCEAIVVQPTYLKVRLTPDQGSPKEAEIFPYVCEDMTGAKVHLVRIQSPLKAVSVLVSPIPSAVLAIILR